MSARHLLFAQALAIFGILGCGRAPGDLADGGDVADGLIDAQPSDSGPCARTDVGPCSEVLEKDDCEELGGIYRGTPFREPWCNCPTSDQGCPCESSSECERACVGPVRFSNEPCKPATHCFGFRWYIGEQCISGPWPRGASPTIPRGKTQAVLFD